MFDLRAKTKSPISQSDTLGFDPKSKSFRFIYIIFFGRWILSVNIDDTKEVLKSSLWNFAVSIIKKTTYQLLACFCRVCDVDVPLLFVLVF